MFQTLRAKILIVAVSLILLTSGATMYFVQRETEKELLSARYNHALTLVHTVALQVGSEYKSLLFHKNVMMERRKLELKNVVDLVSKYIDLNYQSVQDGRITESEARAEVIETIRHLRFDNGVGYIWINDMGRPIPRMIMHPTIPGLNGKILDDPAFNCAQGRRQNLFQAMVDVCLADGEGFVDYLWPKPAGSGLTAEQPKISFVSLFEPWNMVVGAGVYIDDIEAESQKRLEAILVDLEQAFDQVKVAESGYLYLFNGRQDMLIHPSLKGADFSKLLNPVTGNPILEDLMDAARSTGHHLDYKWNKPPEHHNRFDFWKRSYVVRFEPLDWYIASSVYFDEIKAPAQELKMKILYISTLFVAAVLIASLLLSKSLTRPPRKLTAAARRIEHEGIEAGSIPIMGTIETRELGKILGNMLQSIKAMVREKESLLDALETGNRDLTGANDRLQQEIGVRRQAENKLKATLEEKEVLLREIHHRVKNNLAIVISFPRLQGSSFSDERVKLALADSRGRIHAMALIHETLYRSENLADLKVNQYITKLEDAAEDAMLEAAGKVRITIRTDDIRLSIDQAVYRGLILNELITNALKYAFPGDGGVIEITARHGEDPSWVELKVSDNGVGIPSDPAQRRQDSLGMRIISLLIEHQLEG